MHIIIIFIATVISIYVSTKRKEGGIQYSAVGFWTMYLLLEIVDLIKRGEAKGNDMIVTVLAVIAWLCIYAIHRYIRCKSNHKEDNNESLSQN